MKNVILFVMTALVMLACGKDPVPPVVADSSSVDSSVVQDSAAVTPTDVVADVTVATDVTVVEQ
jgi:hypothetical protein